MSWWSLRPEPVCGRALRAAALVACALLAIGAHAATCGNGLAGARILRGEHHLLAYAPDPAPIARGRHFALEVVVCPAPGRSQPERLNLDARMPEHGHGMGYSPQARLMMPGRWRVEGFMLHMAGRWTFSFELGGPGGTERLEEDRVIR